MVVGSGCWFVGRSSRILHNDDRLARSPNLSRSCALRAYRPLRSICFESPQDRTAVLKNYSLAFFVSFVSFVVSLRHRIVRRMLSMGTSIAARKPVLVLGLLFFNETTQ